MATYNRVAVLRHCVESFRMMDGNAEIEYELLVVNNNSTDDTAAYLQTVVQPFFFHIEEPKPGVSYARNSGVEAAKGDYVIFIDDDAKITPDYLQVLNGVLELSPDVFGGTIYPYYLSQKPSWFKDEYEIRRHHSETGWIPSNGKAILSSSNMGFKKSYFEQIGGFNTDLGPKGELFSLGEDSEIIVRAKKLGAQIYYNTDLKVQHLVPDYKLNIAYHFYRAIEQGESLSRNQELNQGTKSNSNDWLFAIEGVAGDITKVLKSDIGSIKRLSSDTAQQYVFETVLPKLRELSYLQSGFIASRSRQSILTKLLNLNLNTIISFVRSRAVKK